MLSESANGSEAPEATGFTAQFQTLARALGYAAGAMEDDLEELADGGATESAASLRMEARYVPVTLMAAALVESLANTILSHATRGEWHRNRKVPRKKKRRLLVDRWAEDIPSALGCGAFVSGAVLNDLIRLSDVRNSVTHSNPRLFSGDDVITDGNTAKWEQLDTRTVRQFVQLPIRLLDALNSAHQLEFTLAAFANDYWLMQAIDRGAGKPGRSPNMWRPNSCEERLRRIREERLS